MTKLFAVLLLSCFLGTTLTACNTVQGAGKDIKAAGGKIEKEANKHKTY